MTDALLAERTVRANDATADQPEGLPQLQSDLLSAVRSSETKSELLQGLAEVLRRYAQLLAVTYCPSLVSAEGEGYDVSVLLDLRGDSGQEKADREQSTALLACACHAATRRKSLQVRRLSSPARVIIAVPVALPDDRVECLGMLFAGKHSTRYLMLLGQLAGTQILIWQAMADVRARAAEAREAVALVELLDRVGAAPNPRHACHLLAGELSSFLGCSRVAIGLSGRDQGRCRVVAVSDVAKFDRRSATIRGIEAAMDEAVRRGEISQWPGMDGEAQHALLSHKGLCRQENCEAALTVPLCTLGGRVTGALTVLGSCGKSSSACRQFLGAAAPRLAAAILVAQRIEGGRCVRLARCLWHGWRTVRGTVAMAAIALGTVALTIPVPYRIRCDCRIEPILRRFVAAPFDGTLEKALVQPGDVVRAGDLLARMDGREIRWQRASVEADRNQALKKRDTAQVARNYAEQQIAHLEMERLELQIRLLDSRAEQLEIRSPADGIVVGGDLDRAEGARLTTGQTLFEIGPLQKMLVEVAVPEGEVARVVSGQRIEMRLDAYPDDLWEGAVARIQPRSEIRDQRNVFIAEVELDNAEGRLRPGMNGRAKIKASPRALGWILFHRPWQYATRKLAW